MAHLYVKLSHALIHCYDYFAERGCVSKTGWQAATDHMHSGKGHADDAYLVMSLRIGGFQGSEQVVNGKSVTLGTISFVFELDCSADCTLFFMQVNTMYCSLRGPHLIKIKRKKNLRKGV